MKSNTESIYSALVEYCREKNIQLGRLIEMGLDGAATFSGDNRLLCNTTLMTLWKFFHYSPKRAVIKGDS